jgi:hypothetical protein
MSSLLTTIHAPHQLESVPTAHRPARPIAGSKIRANVNLPPSRASPARPARWLGALAEYRRSGQWTDISAISDQPDASRVWLMILGVDASACGSSRIAVLK